MKSYGILFSPAMVLAILAGRKHVTRRLDKRWRRVKAGDELWVRETFYITAVRSNEFGIGFRANHPTGKLSDGDGGYNFQSFSVDPAKAGDECIWAIRHSGVERWIPAIHMPRWAARIVLTATEDARAEPLEYVTDVEAMNEGIQRQSLPDLRGNRYHWGDITQDRCPTARDAFKSLWGSLHDKPGERWDDNPEVVRVGFTKGAEAL